MLKKGKQTRYHRLNDTLIIRMIAEQPEFEKRLVFDVAASSSSGNKPASTHIIGTFNCECVNAKSALGDTHSWSSGKMYTEIFVADGADVSECKFDVVVWSQKCIACKATVACDVDEETYCDCVFS